MTAKEIIDAARTLPFSSTRWDELYDEAVYHPEVIDTLAELERKAKYREEYTARMN